MIAKKCMIHTGVGVSESRLVSFDKALLNANVGNYNLVRLSSILPPNCEWVNKVDLEEGSLLPTAYSTVSGNLKGQMIASSIGVGIPADGSKVGVIMEYSSCGETKEEALSKLHSMIREAFAFRGWELKEIISDAVSDVVNDDMVHTTFACIAEW